MGLSILLIAAAAFAADQDLFDVYSLEVEGNIYDFVSGNFDDDGLTDLAIIYSPLENPSGRYVGLYLQKGTDGFRPRADYLEPLPPSAVQIDIGDIDGDQMDEIVIIDAEGVSYIDYGAGTGLSRPIRLINQNTVFAMPAFFGIVAEPFVSDIVANNTGPEIIVPVSDGFVLYGQNDNTGYKELARLDAGVYCRNDRLGIRNFSGKRNTSVTMELPRLNVLDGNGDNRRDIYLLWHQKVCVFFQNEAGGFSKSPDAAVSFFADKPGGFLQSRLVDCNGDKRPDIAVSLTAGGITNTETTLRYYLADNSGIIRNTQSREVNLSDSHCNLMITDFNGDNIPEVVVPAIEMGAIAASKMFLLKKTDLHLLIYPMLNGLPAAEPDKRIEYEFRFDFEHPNPTGEISINWDADYNHDTLRDAVFSDGNGRLLFFWGNTKDYLSRRPDLEIPLDHPATVYPLHLNRGTLSDLVVEHNLTGRFDRLTILKNRNNKL